MVWPFNVWDRWKKEKRTQWAWEMSYLKQQVRYRHDLWIAAENQNLPDAHQRFNDYLDAKSRFERKKNS